MTPTEPQAAVRAQERKALTVHDLFLYLRLFKEDNYRNSAVENRWLAKHLEPLIEITRQLYASGKCDAVADQIREFRRQELRDEIALKQMAVSNLEHELERMK